MFGLKTQENQKFGRFWQLIQDTANNHNCAFFGFAGEGRDFETCEMEGEDFSGWLVPLAQVAAFEAVWSVPSTDFETLGNTFPEAQFIYAIWTNHNGTISITFQAF